MARTGRPPVPTELKRKRGTLRASRLPDPAVVLVAVDGELPQPPDGLGAAGLALWECIWTSGRHWISPSEAGLEARWLCEAADERERLRELVRLGGDEKYRRAQRDLEKQMSEWVQNLGFSPTARARLGLAEVRTVSKLDALRAQSERRT